MEKWGRVLGKCFKLLFIMYLIDGKSQEGIRKRLPIMCKHRDRHTIGMGTILSAIFLTQILVGAARE